MWAYRIVYKAPIGMLLYLLVYGKDCHFSMELEHRALWALRRLNFKHDEALQAQITKLHLLDDFRLKAYESSALYEEKKKRWHDLKILKIEFVDGDPVMLYTSSIHLFLRKLKSK